MERSSKPARRTHSSARCCPRYRLPRTRADGGGRRICLHSARSITLPWTWRDGLARRETEREARQKAEGGRRPSHAAYHQDWRKGDLSKESILNRGVCTALTRRQSLHLQTCISFLLALAPRPCPQPRSLPPPSQSASAEQSRSVGRSSGYECMSDGLCVGGDDGAAKSSSSSSSRLN